MMLYPQRRVSAIGLLIAAALFLSTRVQAQDCISPEIKRASVASDGTQADRESQTPALSADGRFVAFVSLATNLVSDDTNGALC